MTDRAFPPSTEPGLTPPDLRPDEIPPDGTVRDEADGPGASDATSISRAALAAEPDGPLLGRRQWPLPKQADPNAPLLVVEDLKTYFALESGTVQRGRRRQLPARRTARRWGSPANPAAARRPPRCRSSGSCRRTRPIVEGSIKLMGIDLVPKSENAAAPLSLARDQHRLPGRDERAQPGPARPRPDRRADRGPSRPVAQGGPQASRRAARAGRHPAASAAGPTRTSCRAGCASAR